MACVLLSFARSLREKLMSRFLLLLAVAFTAIPLHAQTIKIGLVTALSGQSARAGEAITRGLTVAIDEINAKGGGPRAASSSWCAATTRRRRPRA